MRVTGNYLEVIGAEVAVGRRLTSTDASPESAPTVVISDGLWKRRFGASRDVIGRTLRLNGEAFTVIGVLRADFTFQVREAELLVPWVPERDPRRTNPALSFLRVVGRLAPGSGAPQARAELDAQIAEFRRRYPDAIAADGTGRVVPLREDIIGSVDRPLKILAAAMALILLIAAANLTNLLLINGASRQQEFATRRSLGAGSGRLIAQLLAEAFVLAATGALIGIVVASLATSALLALGGDVLPRAAEIRLGVDSIGFALLLAVGIAVATAVLPALQLSYPSHNVASQRSVTLGGRRLRAAFVSAEVALSVLLIIGAGLLVRSFAAVQRVEPGFQPSGVVSVRLSLPRARYTSTATITRFYDQLAPRLRGVAGVAGAAAANVVPMNGYLATSTIEVPGVEMQTVTDPPDVHYRMISPEYFSVMGIPVVSGRSFTEADGASGMPVAIVSRGLAKRYWQDTSPIGGRIRVRDDDGRFRTVEIVGVVGDVKHFGLEAETPRELYVPLPQVPDATSIWLANNMYWVVKTHGNPLSYAQAIRREVAAVDADVASSFVRSMDQWLSQSVDTRRFNLRVIAAFAVDGIIAGGDRRVLRSSRGRRGSYPGDGSAGRNRCNRTATHGRDCEERTRASPRGCPRGCGQRTRDNACIVVVSLWCDHLRPSDIRRRIAARCRRWQHRTVSSSATCRAYRPSSGAEDGVSRAGRGFRMQAIELLTRRSVYKQQQAETEGDEQA